MKIGIIGGYGKFGSKLTERLETRGFEILRSDDKFRNREIAYQSDVLFLAVPPSQIEAVLSEICDQVEQIKIISCVAFIDLERIVELTHADCARIMCDPFFNFLAVFGDLENGIEALESLSKNRIDLLSDEEINRFTKILSVFFVSLSVQGVDSPLFLETYQYLLEYFSDNCLQRVLSEFSITTTDLFLTQGGISEFILSHIDIDNGVSFDELMNLIDKEFA